MPTSILIFAVLALSGSALLAISVARGGFASWRRLSPPARLMLAFFCSMPLIQLVPLPPEMWHALPGRTLAVATLDVVGAGNQWRPITLAVEPTLRTFLVFVWLATFLLMVLELSPSDMHRLFKVLVALGTINVVIGIFQVISGSHLLQFYPIVDDHFLIGLFANKNHTALFIIFTFLAGFVVLDGENGVQRQRLTLVLPIGLVLLVALMATFSRAGLVLGTLAIGFVIAIGSRSRLEHTVRRRLLAVIVVVVVLLVTIVSTDLASRALSRFTGVDRDLRWSIWQWTWPLVQVYFPIGGGLGSFTSLFPSAEKLAWVVPTYVNHVHNDYIEQLIEVGVAAPIFWTLALATVAGPVRKAWAKRSHPSGRMALTGAAMLALVALHSIVDYPLRRPAIAVTAMMALAALLRIAIAEKAIAPHDGVCEASVG